MGCSEIAQRKSTRLYIVETIQENPGKASLGNWLAQVQEIYQCMPVELIKDIPRDSNVQKLPKKSSGNCCKIMKLSKRCSGHYPRTRKPKTLSKDTPADCSKKVQETFQGMSRELSLDNSGDRYGKVQETVRGQP